MKTSAPPSHCHRHPTAAAPCLPCYSLHLLSVIQGLSLHSVATIVENTDLAVLAVHRPKIWGVITIKKVQSAFCGMKIGT